ncbi:MAG: hypothetical protein IKR59_01900 [Lachnospiraceae bacterium]|nr:hypothetical protein [Lachnospiraceae bacterium]
MIKKKTLHFLITVSSIIVSTALLMLPSPAAEYVAWFCPGLFLAVLCGICCGFFPALLVGLLPPFAAYLVRNFSLPGAEFALYVPMGVLAVSGIMAAIVYGTLHSSIGASVSAVLAGRLVLGIANLILYHVLGDTYTIRRFVTDGFVSVWAGLLAVVILIPIIILIFRRRGVMKLLRDEKPTL